MTTKLETLKADLADAERKAKAIRDEVARVERAAQEDRLIPLRDLAKRAHDLLCGWNHTDGCGWFYETKDGVEDWNGWVHSRWLHHVFAVVQGAENPGAFTSGRHGKPVSVEAFSALLDHVEQMRKAHPEALWLLRHRLVPL